MPDVGEAEEPVGGDSQVRPVVRRDAELEAPAYLGREFTTGPPRPYAMRRMTAGWLPLFLGGAGAAASLKSGNTAGLIVSLVAFALGVAMIVATVVRDLRKDAPFGRTKGIGPPQ